jgi:general L-amino acid transport system permease protein
MENARLDTATKALIDNANAVEEAQVRPDEPSLPLGEWVGKNLFGTGQNSVAAIIRSTILTLVATAIAIFAYKGVLDFVFSENTRWDAVRTNLRLLFTQAYPDENYARVWVSVGIVMVLAGLSLGLMRVGAGVSMKKIATWCFAWGGLIVAGVFLREPSVLKDSNGLPQYVFPDGSNVARADNETLVTTTEDGESLLAEGETVELIRESFGDAIADRTSWLVLAVVLLIAGAAIWFGLGDKRRRSTFVPAIPLGLIPIGLLVSSTWWYNWGNYTFSDAGFAQEPGVKVATTTRDPWTIMFVLLVGFYVIGRLIKKSDAASNTRGVVNLLWLLAPFVTFWGVLRKPELDWGHVVSTDLPLFALFGLGGAALLWIITKPGIGEKGRLIAIAIIAAAILTWILAFTGTVSMLQKVRLSTLLLGLAALAAPNFIGEARQRLKLVYGWLVFSVIFHILVTLINTPSGIEVPTEDFAGGFMITVYVSIFTMIFSFPLGVLLALARTSKLPLFRMMSTVYIESFRGVPLITMLFFFTVFVNLFLPEGMELNGLAAVSVAFTLFSAAYIAENVRGGLQSIRRGQYEASDALGLTTVQRTAFIVLPQALRVSIPPLVGQVIGTFKETSLLAIVGVFDFLLIARSVIPAQTEFLGVNKEGLLFISAVYFVAAYGMSKYSQRLEKHLGVGER